MNCELSTMNNKLESFSQCLIKNEVKRVEVVQRSSRDSLPLPLLFCESWMFVKENLDRKKKFDGNSNCCTRKNANVSVRKNANEAEKLHQEQARLYQQKHSLLLGNSQQQPQQTSNSDSQWYQNQLAAFNCLSKIIQKNNQILHISKLSPGKHRTQSL